MLKLEHRDRRLFPAITPPSLSDVHSDFYSRTVSTG